MLRKLCVYPGLAWALSSQLGCSEKGVWCWDFSQFLSLVVMFVHDYIPSCWLSHSRKKIENWSKVETASDFYNTVEAANSSAPRHWDIERPSWALLNFLRWKLLQCGNIGYTKDKPVLWVGILETFRRSTLIGWDWSLFSELWQKNHSGKNSDWSLSLGNCLTGWSLNSPKQITSSIWTELRQHWMKRFPLNRLHAATSSIPHPTRRSIPTVPSIHTLISSMVLHPSMTCYLVTPGTKCLWDYTFTESFRADIWLYRVFFSSLVPP